MARKTEFGEVVRYVPAPEPAMIVFVIGILTITEIAFVVIFLWQLFSDGNSVPKQQFLSFMLGAAMFDLAAILSLYRKWFLPDIMIVKKRKQKYEDLL